MRNGLITGVFLLATVVTSFAQVSTEEAAARLREKQAQKATTQPAELVELRAVVADLRAQNKALKADLAASRAELATLRSKLEIANASPSAAALKENPASFLKKGMTKDEIEKALGQPLKPIAANTFSLTYRTRISVSRERGPFGVKEHFWEITVIIPTTDRTGAGEELEKGKLLSFTAQMGETLVSPDKIVPGRP